MIRSKHLSFLLAKILVFGIAFFSLLQIGAAQFVPASPPIANPADTRFRGVEENWTTPALDSSSLKPVPPLVAHLNDNPQFSVELVRVQWRFGDPLDLYVMKPKGVSKPPVILYLYSFPADTDRFKGEEFQSGAVKDGFAAVGFVSALTGHRYHDRPFKEWFISELQESLATSAHDVQMVLNYLAGRGDLDMNRVGMVASGSGASIAILASAVDPRIKVLDAMNPWGDWPVWMATSPFVPQEERAQYVKPEYLEKVAALDPVDWLPKVRAKNFRLQGSAFDTRTPAAALQKLRTAVPASATVTIYKTTDDLYPIVRDHTELQWIKQELKTLSNANGVSLAVTTGK
jgi:hypothetical protein